MQDSTQSLLSHFKTTSVTKDMFAPATGEQIQIGEQIASYSVMLGDSISARLNAKWSKVSDGIHSHVQTADMPV